MMIDIQKVDLVGMNNGAHYEFMKVVSDRFATETALSTNAAAKKAIEALAAAVKEEDRCLVISQKSLITDDIKAADDKRDNIFRGLRKSIKGLTDAPVADVAQAAKELQQCLVDYRIDPAMQLDRETGLLHNFIADLETKYAAQVTKLGLTLFVAPLKEANAKVEQFIVDRTTAQSVIAAGELRAARLATDAAYRHLVKFVNALAMVSGTTDYDALAKFLNEHIDRYKHEVLPKKKKGGKKPSDGDKPGDGKKPSDGGKKPDGKKPGGDAAKPGDGGDRLAGATVTVLGAAFKPDSDDMRNSPALDLAVELAHLAKRVVVHDPAAGPILAERSNRPYEVALSARSALEGTDLVLIGTEWREYRDLDPAQAADLARTRYVIDGRNCLDAQAWKAAGWSYRGIGRR